MSKFVAESDKSFIQTKTFNQEGIDTDWAEYQIEEKTKPKFLELIDYNKDATKFFSTDNVHFGNTLGVYLADGSTHVVKSNNIGLTSIYDESSFEQSFFNNHHKYNTVFNDLNSINLTFSLSSVTLPVPLSDAQVIRLKDRVYLIGGTSNGFVQNKVYYTTINTDGTINNWVQTTNVLQAAVAGFRTVLIGNNLYVLGGYDDTASVNTIQKTTINPDGDIPIGWTGLSSLTLPQIMNSFEAVIIKDKLYIIGGKNSSYLDTIYFINIVNNELSGSWTQLGVNLPVPLSNFKAVIVKDRLYIIGGETSTGSSDKIYYADIDSNGIISQFNLYTNSQLPIQISSFDMVVTKNKIYLVGGYDGSSSKNSIIYGEIDSNGDLVNWTEVTNSLPEMLSSSSVFVTNNYMYILGGNNGSNDVNSIYSASYIGWKIYRNNYNAQFYKYDLSSENLSIEPVKVFQITKSQKVEIDKNSSSTTTLIVKHPLSEKTDKYNLSRTQSESYVLSSDKKELFKPGSKLVVYNSTDGYKEIDPIILNKSVNVENLFVNSPFEYFNNFHCQNILKEQGRPYISKWMQVTDDLSEPLHSSATVRLGNYVYIIGGTNDIDGQTSKVYVSTIQNDGTLSLWTAHAYDYPIVLTNRPGTIQYNGYLYVLGGNNNSIYKTQIASDGSIGDWTSAGTLPLISSYSSFVLLKNYVYIFGGDGSNVIYRGQIDASGNIGSWTQIGTGYFNQNVNFVTKSYIYILTDRLYRYRIDPDGTINYEGFITTLPFNAMFSSVILTKDYVYLLGNDTSSNIYYSEIDGNGNVGEWKLLSDSQIPANIDAANVVVTEKYVYIIGGKIGTTALNTVYKADFDGWGYFTVDNKADSNVITYTLDISSLNNTSIPEEAYEIKSRLDISVDSNNANINEMILPIDNTQTTQTEIVTDYMWLTEKQENNLFNTKKIKTDTGLDIDVTSVIVKEDLSYSSLPCQYSHHTNLSYMNPNVESSVTLSTFYTLTVANVFSFPTSVRIGNYYYMFGGNDATHSVRYSTNGSDFYDNKYLFNSVLYNPIVFVTGKYVYIIGGNNIYGHGTNDVRYTLIPDNVMLGPFYDDTPLPFYVSTAFSFTTKNYVYIIGGFDENGNLTDKIYRARINPDETISDWILYGTFPFPTAGHINKPIIAEDKVYIFPEYENGNLNSNSVYVANIDSEGNLGSFTYYSTRPIRGRSAIVIYKNYLYSFGYYYVESNIAYDGNLVYRAPITGNTLGTTWSNIGTLPNNGTYANTFVTHDGKIILHNRLRSGGWSADITWCNATGWDVPVKSYKVCKKYQLTTSSQITPPKEVVTKATNPETYNNVYNLTFDDINGIYTSKYNVHQPSSTFRSLQLKWHSNNKDEENSELKVDLWKV